MSIKTIKNLINYNGIDPTVILCEPATIPLDGLEVRDNCEAISVEPLAQRWYKARKRDRELRVWGLIL